jgi:hypothetical protein
MGSKKGRVSPLLPTIASGVENVGADSFVAVVKCDTDRNYLKLHAFGCWKVRMLRPLGAR